MGSVNEKIFRAYDIRGIYPDEINEASAYQIGRGFAAYLLAEELEKPEKIAAGYDSRLSSPMLFRSFAQGINDSGIDVLNIGLSTVDMIYFASGSMHLPAAMVTASHHPKEWNGFKLMESNVEFFPVKDLLEARFPTLSITGEITNEDIKTDYLKHVLGFINIKTIKPMRVAIDTGSGAVGPVIKKVLEKIPINYTPLYFAPNGDFPYREPNPSLKNNLEGLVEEVKTHHYHFGCAFDGDGDRIIFVDENGDAVNPSIIAALMSRYFLSGTRGEKVVYDATISRLIPEIIQIYNGEAAREKVGHTFISRRLKEVDGIFGAEKSGHYFFRNNFYADSGIISFLVMLNILGKEKKSLSALVSNLGKYFSVPEINFKIKEPESFIKKIAQNFEGYEIDWLDGLTVTTSDFWLNLRPSNTEPLVRLNIEAKDEIVLNRVKKDLINLIKREKTAI